MRDSGLLRLAAIFALAVLATTTQLSAQSILGITAQGTAALPNVEVANNGSIQFQNNASFPVSITFTTSSGAVCSDIVSLGAGQNSNSQTPQQLNMTVNYTITNLSNGQVRGPYGLEVGTGPITINVSSGLPDLDTVSIPVGGEIQFNSDASYVLTCSPANLIRPNLTSLNPGLNPVQTSNQSVNCTIASPSNGRAHNPNHQVSMMVS